MTKALDFANHATKAWIEGRDTRPVALHSLQPAVRSVLIVADTSAQYVI